MDDWYEPRRVFDESFSDQLQRGILRCVIVGWTEATRSVRLRFDREAAHDLIGYERRAYIEQSLRALAKRYGINCQKGKLNYAANAFHTELVAGRTVLTASALEWSEQIVRPAIFRNTLARDPQANLFEQEIPPQSDDPLYGIIIYGPPPKSRDQRLPGFVKVAFPDQDCTRYLDSVDLLVKYPQAVRRLVLRLRREEETA